jgi:hypothetical protein
MAETLVLMGDSMELLTAENISFIVNGILVLLYSFLGPKHRKDLRKMKAFYEIAEDGNISKEEEKKIKKFLEKL